MWPDDGRIPLRKCHQHKPGDNMCIVCSNGRLDCHYAGEYNDTPPVSYHQCDSSHCQSEQEAQLNTCFLCETSTQDWMACNSHYIPRLYSPAVIYHNIQGEGKESLKDLW